MPDPAIILADEPVASLDPAISRDVLALLRSQAHVWGATVLCSLHQVDLAREFADRVVALDRGQIIFDGAPDELLEGDLATIYARSEAPASGTEPIVLRKAG